MLGSYWRCRDSQSGEDVADEEEAESEMGASVSASLLPAGPSTDACCSRSWAELCWALGTQGSEAMERRARNQ